MGERGRERTRAVTWPHVARRLLQAAYSARDARSQDRFTQEDEDADIKVAVLDMQPIDPPIGGGRLRLLGLYHALGPGFQTRYVGSYDWPGERFRRQQLSPTLEEIIVPLSEDHHAAASDLARQAAGKVVIDVAFPRLGHLSADYLAAARAAVDWADIVIFSHPWVYPLVAERVRKAQIVVYESHNVEGFLRAQILDGSRPVERELLREIIAAEHQAGLRADLVLACSAADRDRFARVYEWPYQKMRVVPNGVMSGAIRPASDKERQQAKRSLGLKADLPAVLFIGSAYGPNVEAARFIVDRLAPALAEMYFVIAGGVGTELAGSVAKNVQITGTIDEESKLRWLRACDFGVNPMFSGSGTNIKMFDLMAAGLPTVTTAVGARGIERGGRQPFAIAAPNAQAFISVLRRLAADCAVAATMGREARECVDDGYSWERISPFLGTLLRKRLRQGEKPYFSVVVPTFDRHSQLDALMDRLESQTEHDFEVIVVDQSPKRWSGKSLARRFRLTYVHTDVRGAVRARNTGADFAVGRVIAFTDDDCLPEPDWLQSARRHFEARPIVGLEGAIESDHLGDPAFRPVTNIGFEGVGFMTANLFVLAEAFHRINGFDLDFDRPHFREDTDLGWRLWELGEVPYGRDVRVFHPAQPRAVERESQATRARFFQKDALLLSKHPLRYKQLFECEGHWVSTPGFWENFEYGAHLYAVDISEYLSKKPRRAQRPSRSGE